MAAGNDCSSVLKDVVAYVDVWSSNKTENYSKPFIQQLQEMGAQVSKTFNKQVTHVVFNNGHQATWKKAKTTGVRLVSVLWLARCKDDGVHVDEELYPALNDERYPELKKRTHRCMQPRDSPERTPENDRRMRKKLDKMIKELPPKTPLVTDVSPYIIDEENGIVYSPSMKRSDSMAQRLKEMREKRENLSPTASQMVESCSSPGLKPTLGNTPTIFKLLYESSDDDSSATSAAQPDRSSDRKKEEERTQLDDIDHCHLEPLHRKDAEKPWLSPCSDVAKRKSMIPLKIPDLDDKEKGSKQKKARRSSVKKQPVEKHNSAGSLESPCQDGRSEDSKNSHNKKRRSQIKSCSLAIEKRGQSPNKLEIGKRKTRAVQSLTESKTRICPEVLNSPSCLSSPAILGNTLVDQELSKGITSPSQKVDQQIPKRARPSFSALVQSFTLPSESLRVPSSSIDEDDGVFEDYFSPANHKRQQTPLLPNLPSETQIQIPFELDSVTGKRKQRKSETPGTKTVPIKKRKREETQSVKNPGRQSDSVQSEPQMHPHQDVRESPPAVDSRDSVAPATSKRSRQGTLLFMSTSEFTADPVKQRKTSVPVQPPTLSVREDSAASDLQKNSDVSVLSHTMEIVGEGSEHAAAAGSTETVSEGLQSQNKQVNLNVKKMDRTKSMRTLVMTSMPTEKQHTVAQVVKTLGGFSIVDRVCDSTTHVVSGGHRRTLNILLGIARGCWILSFEWILWCLEQRQWIPEEPYELSDHFPAASVSTSAWRLVLVSTTQILPALQNIDYIHYYNL
ncbi:microcephalin-like [Centroberyx affinis]|uniref:microcephalin-like n=1 Tax=Centroberyx affinis TaxID=166261 RepID=UPI003A5BEA10